MRHAPGRRAGSAAFTALLVLAATACMGDRQAATPAPAPSLSATPADPAVEVSGLPDGVEVEVTDSSPGIDIGENLDFVTPVLTLAPAGPVDGTATVRLKLDNALPTSVPVLVGVRQGPQDPWAFEQGRLSGDRSHVEFTATSLNQVGAVTVDVDGALASLQVDFSSVLGGALVNAGVKRPRCAGTEEARQDGYSVSSWKKETVHWCFGLEGGKRVIKVTNRRLVPFEITHPDVGVLEAPRAARAWEPWVRVLGDANTVLSPARTVTYDADLQQDTNLVLSAESSATGQSLRLVQAAAGSLVMRLDRFGVRAPDVTESVSALLSVPKCAESLSQGSAAVLDGCLSPASLVQTFGAEGQLLVPLVAAPSFRYFYNEQSATLARQTRAEELQRILLERVPPDFAGLVGGWSGPTRSLTVTRQGQVFESYGSASGPVIELVYQLSDPVVAGGRASARSTITMVKVNNRGLLNGRVPRIGDPGTIQLSKGVVVPPYLRTTYCNGAARQRGACAT
jgi:hypothetical protein